jgi:hypothetical protein
MPPESPQAGSRRAPSRYRPGSVEEALSQHGWLDAEIAVHRQARKAPPRKSALAAANVSLTVAPRRAPVEATYDEMVATRRSCRDFADAAMSLEDLVGLFGAAVGRREGGRAFAAAGDQNVIGVLLLARKVTCAGQDLPCGVYGLRSEPPAAARSVATGSWAEVSACVDLTDIRFPAAVCVLSVDVGARRRYRHSYELALMECGMVLQNLALVAAASGVGCCVLGAVYDEPFWLALGAPDWFQAIKAIGVPAVAIAFGLAREAG